MLAEILYSIYVEDDNKAEKILNFFDGMSYFNSGISHCHADWGDEGVLVRASVTEDWSEKKATKAMMRLLSQNNLQCDKVEAEFTL